MSPPSTVLVATAPAGQQAAASAAKVDAAFRAVSAGQPESRIADYATTHDPHFIGSDGRTTIGLLVSKPFTSFSAQPPGTAVTALLQQQLPGWKVGVTGLDQLASGESNSGPGVLVETLIGAAGALVWCPC
jgi:RND superfamily putative drug exporter